MVKPVTMHKEFTNQGTRETNQDSLLACTVDNIAVRNLDRGELFIVADGMGGHRAGKEAALEVCDRLFDEYYSAELEVDTENPGAMEGVLETLFKEINMHMEKKGKEGSDRLGWGCTVSALLIWGHLYYFAHAGDTRIYLFRDGVSKLLTEDQNVGFQMYKYGQVSYEEYLEGTGHNKLLSYMGQGKGISVKTGHGNIMDGDIFLICSDGLNQFAEIHDMENLAREISIDSDNLPDHLFSVLTKKLIREEQAEDNVTFMLVRLIK